MDQSKLSDLWQELDGLFADMAPEERAEYEHLLATFVRGLINSHWLTRKRGVSDADTQQRPAPRGSSKRPTTTASLTCPCCQKRVSVRLTC